MLYQQSTSKPAASAVVQNQMQGLFECLLGRSVKVHTHPSGAFAGPLVNAVYATDDGTVRGFCTVDLPLAAYVAAALSLVPVGVAKEAIAAGRLSEELLDNIHEVFNVCARLLNEQSTKHVTLAEVAMGKGVTLKTSANSTYRDLHFDLAVSGYGNGHLELQYFA